MRYTQANVNLMMVLMLAANLATVQSNLQQ